MKNWGCASLVVGPILFLMIFGMILLHPQTCAEWVLPRESFEEKDADFLISKLKSWRINLRDRAVWYLADKTDDRDREKIIAALTHTLLNDSHEEVRVSAAHVLARLTPPATEAVPALEEALNLPENNRGKPPFWLYDGLRLPQAAEEALDSISGAQKMLDAIKESGSPPIESSVPDGASEVDAEHINQHGITLRLPLANTPNLLTRVYCEILDPDRRWVWRHSLRTGPKDIVTTIKRRSEKRRSDYPKLLNGTVYVLEVECNYLSTTYLRTTFTFTTKP